MKQLSLKRSIDRANGSKKAVPILHSVDEMFKNKPMTFEDIHTLNYKQFIKPGTKHESFRPSDILDMDD